MEPILLGWTLIDLAVVGGVALVLPACLPGGRWWWLAAGAAAASCWFAQGSVPAIALALAWPATVVLVGLGTIVRLRTIVGLPPAAVGLLAVGYSLVAAAWFVLHRAGQHPMGIGEPIVELTAVHFTFAGVGALALADRARRAVEARRSQPGGTFAVGATAAAPLVVATGFATGWALAQVGGAILMALGVFATAALQLAEAARPGDALRRGSGPGDRALLAISGLAVWAPMVLAVVWAAAQHLDLPALSIPDMVRTHGAGNAIGFVGAGLLARRHAEPWWRMPVSPSERAEPELEEVGAWS